MDKKLREVCEELNISRRTVQGYEKMGLVKATGRNKYGHLLYDERGIEKIRLVRFYQSIGFPLKEILQLMDAPVAVQRAMLEDKLKELEKESVRLEQLILELKQHIQKLA